MAENRGLQGPRVKSKQEQHKEIYTKTNQSKEQEENLAANREITPHYWEKNHMTGDCP
jgi:hypothetical protein